MKSDFSAFEFSLVFGVDPPFSSRALRTSCFHANSGGIGRYSSRRSIVEKGLGLSGNSEKVQMKHREFLELGELMKDCLVVNWGNKLRRKVLI